MSSQKQILKSEIAKGIKELYSFCGYELDRDTVIKLSNLVIEAWPTLSKKQFDKFIHQAQLGEFGMIYKAPISFMVALKAYKNENYIEHHTVVTSETELR